MTRSSSSGSWRPVHPANIESGQGDPDHGERRPDARANELADDGDLQHADTHVTGGKEPGRADAMAVDLPEGTAGEREPGHADTLAASGGRDAGRGEALGTAPTLASPAPSAPTDGGDPRAPPRHAAGLGGALTAELPGRYEIRGELATGGQARVYVAYDTHLGREIAFKTPRTSHAPDGGASREILERFLREAQITARLEHPNIVPIYEIGQREDGSYYCAQKLIRSGDQAGPSRTLRRALSGAASSSERLQLLPHFLDVCNAIAHAHEQGILHRDIKPDNVVIGRLGETVVLDWGLAKVIGEPGAAPASDHSRAQEPAHSAAGMTVAGFAFGTPSYMSPEQAAGELDKVDARSDIFSLGALLYEILTGTPPFVGESGEQIIARARTEAALPIRARAPDAPPALAAVAEKTLARDPEARYQSAAELAEEIAAYEAGVRVGVYRYSLWEHVQLFFARHRAVSLITIAAVALLVVAGGIAWRGYQQAEAHLGDAREHLSHALVEKARRAESRLQWDRAAAFYAAARAEADLPEARWGALLSQNRGLRGRTHLYEHPGLQNLALSPQGDLLGTVGADGALAIYDLEAERVRDRFSTDAVIFTLAFSPSGDAVATVDDGGSLTLWSLESGEGRRLYHHDWETNAVAFSPTGDRIALATADSWLKVYDLSRDEIVMDKRVAEGVPLYGVAYTPDGDTLVVAGRDGLPRLFDAQSEEPIRELQAHSGPFTMAISPGGDVLATGGFDNTVKLWRIADGELIHHLEGHSQRVFGVAFSPRGELLASGSTDRTVRVWDARTGRSVVGESFGTDDPVRTLAFSRNGDAVIWGGGNDLWLRRLGEVSARSESAIQGLALSPDGAHLAHNFDDQLMLRDAAGDVSVALKPTPGGPDNAERAPGTFTPDGRRFLAPCNRRRHVCAWNVDTNELAWWVDANERASAVAISGDGRFVAVGDDRGAIAVWRLSDQQLIEELDTPYEDRVYTLDFSPDGKKLASGSWEMDAIVWETERWEQAARLQGHTHAVQGVRFSPRGDLLATASNDLSIRLWDPESGRELAVLAGHEGPVTDIAFDPEQRFFVSGSHDGTLRVWDAEDRRQLASFVSDEAQVFAVKIFPGADRIAYAGREVHILDLAAPEAPGQELARVLNRTGLALRGIDLERRTSAP